MKNIDKLILIYFYICKHYDNDLSLHCQRMSNNCKPLLSDQEVLTIFFYCLIVEKRMEIKDIYEFADNYLRSWFPNLGNSYESYLTRLNNLNEVFPAMIHLLINEKMSRTNPEEIKIYQDLLFSMVDSMPIILAKGARRFRATVAPELCDKGFCSSKNLNYYGLKFHVLGFSRFGKLPVPEYVGTSPASNHDLSVFKPIFESMNNRAIFADKAYPNEKFEQYLKKHNNLYILTPVKMKKGQAFLDAADKLYSFAVSQIRQPIESFFNWIIDKTAIQAASKIRSTKGLLTHVYGRFAAAMMIMTFDYL